MLNIFQIFKTLKFIWTHPSNKGEKLYRIFLFPVWQIFKRFVGSAILIYSSGKKFLIFPDCMISSMMIYFKEPECSEIKRFREFARKDTKVFFDVGANIGLYTVILGGDFSTIHSFEPNPNAFFRLGVNVKLNSHDDFTSLNQLGVSSVNGNMFLSFSSIVDPMARLIEKQAYSSSNDIPVKVITLDEYIKKNQIDEKIALKIDVEGSEIDVLKGAKDSLCARQFSIIQYECLNELSFDDVYRFIKDFDYEVFYDNISTDFIKTNKWKNGVNNYYLLLTDDLVKYYE
jgi:FkbM family methyltransferase